ncbi:Uncharacterised protein [Mycolicibacterium fortuitum]|uniref:Uncharacterized protein n=1 Tax=Mycolicibacterium fortuitum TaxID=1766 RepID=A0A378WF22_MYCFO|nr:Uncharacterised protein [Mycolicibacterium fortuitum]
MLAGVIFVSNTADDTITTAILFVALLLAVVVAFAIGCTSDHPGRRRITGSTAIELGSSRFAAVANLDSEMRRQRS